jgi:hypothetical protein
MAGKLDLPGSMRALARVLFILFVTSALVTAAEHGAAPGRVRCSARSIAFGAENPPGIADERYAFRRG